ncbi:MAG: hypothetical protein R3E63_03720 [Pseudomonadales bacterium]
MERLCHYWIFYRQAQDKNEMIIGTIQPPYYLDPAVDAINREHILARLREVDAFDVALQPADGDLLVLSFQAADGKVDYGFEYSAGCWREKEYNSLMWLWHHDEEMFGKIRNALAR